MKIKSLYVDNFKSMNDFQMIFDDYVIIIGNNSVGKTTLLHVLDFLHYACIYDLDKYMEERGFKPSELLSQFSNKKSITARITFDNNGNDIHWEVTFSVSKNNIAISQEKVFSSERNFLEITSKFTEVYSYIAKENKKFNKLPLNSSYIKYFVDEKEYPILSAIRNFFVYSNFCDLLSPSDMRKPNRYESDDIGQKGAFLSGYIKNLNQEERNSLVKDIKKYFLPISNLKIVSSGRGWFRLTVGEVFDDNNIEVSASQVSDGLLRLIAMFSLKYAKRSNDFDGGLLVLDEIEDGINTENLEGLYEAFRDMSKSGIQVVITTHSTVLLDYAKPTEIWYAARRDNGFLEIVPMKHIKHLMEMLDDRYPGEAVLSTDDRSIRNSLLEYLEAKIENDTEVKNK